MVFNLPLLGLMIISLWFEFGENFQTDCLGTDQQLPKELRSLIDEPVFGFDEQFSMSWCRKHHPDNVSLDLSNLGITRLSENFIFSENVNCLNLQENNFQETVEFDIFKKLPNLEYLNLAGNNLNLQKTFIFASHPKIKTLVLDNTRSYKGYDFFPIYDGLRALPNLPKLEKLSLRRLNMGRDSYINFCHIYLYQSNLTYLILSENKIHQEYFICFENFPETLKHLFMERCNLYSFSEAYIVTSLISLSLDGNLFSCLNDDCLNFKNHPELQYLSLANCNISVLSPNIFHPNKKLVYLDLSENKLQQLPEQLFSNTSGLMALNLNNNRFWKVPYLHSAYSLKKLYLKGNRITNLDRNSFYSFQDLQILSLSSNNIGYIDKSVFQYLKRLIVLDLSHNNLIHLQIDYHASNYLAYLILRNNSVNCIQLDSYTSLKYLDLEKNPIMNLQTDSPKCVSKGTTIVSSMILLGIILFLKITV